MRLSRRKANKKANHAATFDSHERLPVAILLPLLAFFLLEARLASNELAAVERLAPQSAAQSSAFPAGREILIEGRLDRQNTNSLDSPPIDSVEDRYRDADLSGQWYASQVVLPFAAALPDGVARMVTIA